MQKSPKTKYKPWGTIDFPGRTWPNRTIDQVPDWCSVDLRDGNQALPIPMGIKEKLELFKLLVEIGFKEIEVGLRLEFDQVGNGVEAVGEAKLIDHLPGSGMDGKHDRHLGAYLHERFQDFDKGRFLIHIGWTVQRQEGISLSADTKVIEHPCLVYLRTALD